MNTTSTKVELVWNVDRSASVDDEQRARIREKLGNRIDSEGDLSVVSSTTRSQHRNREDATARFINLLREALRVPKQRKRTRPPREANETRLAEKRRQSEKKKLRQAPPLD